MTRAQLPVALVLSMIQKRRQVYSSRGTEPLLVYSRHFKFALIQLEAFFSFSLSFCRLSCWRSLMSTAFPSLTQTTSSLGSKLFSPARPHRSYEPSMCHRVRSARRMKIINLISWRKYLGWGRKRQQACFQLSGMCPECSRPIILF